MTGFSGFFDRITEWTELDFALAVSGSRSSSLQPLAFSLQPLILKVAANVLCISCVPSRRINPAHPVILSKVFALVSSCLGGKNKTLPGISAFPVFFRGPIKTQSCPSCQKPSPPWCLRVLVVNKNPSPASLRSLRSLAAKSILSILEFCQINPAHPVILSKVLAPLVSLCLGGKNKTPRQPTITIKHCHFPPSRKISPPRPNPPSFPPMFTRVS